MKIVIAGGSNTADYIIKNFKGHSHQLTIINFDREAANYLAKSSKLPVFYGDPTKPYCLKDAQVDFETKIFINRFKPAPERINNREISNDELFKLLAEINTLIKNNDLGKDY